MLNLQRRRFCSAAVAVVVQQRSSLVVPTLIASSASASSNIVRRSCVENKNAAATSSQQRQHPSFATSCDDVVLLVSSSNLFVSKRHQQQLVNPAMADKKFHCSICKKGFRVEGAGRVHLANSAGCRGATIINEPPPESSSPAVGGAPSSSNQQQQFATGQQQASASAFAAGPPQQPVARSFVTMSKAEGTGSYSMDDRAEKDDTQSFRRRIFRAPKIAVASRPSLEVPADAMERMFEMWDKYGALRLAEANLPYTPKLPVWQVKVEVKEHDEEKKKYKRTEVPTYANTQDPSRTPDPFARFVDAKSVSVVVMVEGEEQSAAGASAPDNVVPVITDFSDFAAAQVSVSPFVCGPLRENPFITCPTVELPEIISSATTAQHHRTHAGSASSTTGRLSGLDDDDDDVQQRSSINNMSVDGSSNNDNSSDVLGAGQPAAAASFSFPSFGGGGVVQTGDAGGSVASPFAAAAAAPSPFASAVASADSTATSPFAAAASAPSPFAVAPPTAGPATTAPSSSIQQQQQQQQQNVASTSPFTMTPSPFTTNTQQQQQPSAATIPSSSSSSGAPPPPLTSFEAAVDLSVLFGATPGATSAGGEQQERFACKVCGKDTFKTESAMISHCQGKHGIVINPSDASGRAGGGGGGGKRGRVLPDLPPFIPTPVDLGQTAPYGGTRQRASTTTVWSEVELTPHARVISTITLLGEVSKIVDGSASGDNCFQFHVYIAPTATTDEENIVVKCFGGEHSAMMRASIDVGCMVLVEGALRLNPQYNGSANKYYAHPAVHVARPSGFVQRLD